MDIKFLKWLPLILTKPQKFSKIKWIFLLMLLETLMSVCLMNELVMHTMTLMKVSHQDVVML